MCDGVFQCRGEDKMFPLLCSLGRPLYRQFEAGGGVGGGGGAGGGQNQQGKKEKVQGTTPASIFISPPPLSLSLRVNQC